MLESLFNKVAGFQACSFIKKRLPNRCFPVVIASTYFVKPLWTAASYNQILKISTSETNLPKGVISWFFILLNLLPVSILNFALTKWFCHGTCFAKVFLLFFCVRVRACVRVWVCVCVKQFYDIFIIKKLFIM